MRFMTSIWVLSDDRRVRLQQKSTWQLFPIHAVRADLFLLFLFHQLPKAKKSSPTLSGATKPKSSSVSPPNSNTTTSTSTANPSRRPKPLGSIMFSRTNEVSHLLSPIINQPWATTISPNMTN